MGDGFGDFLMELDDLTDMVEGKSDRKNVFHGREELADKLSKEAVSRSKKASKYGGHLIDEDEQEASDIDDGSVEEEEDEEEDGDSDGEGGEEGSLEPKSIEDVAATANDGDAKGGGDVEGGAEGYGNVEGEGVEYEGELGEGGQEYEERQYDNVEDDQYAELEPGQQEVVIEQ